MHEFDNHDVNTSVHLDNLSAKQRRQTLGLGAPETDKLTPSTEDEEEDNEDEEEEDDNGTDNDRAENEKNNHDQQHEPSLFDILEEDVEIELGDDLPSDQQE